MKLMDMGKHFNTDSKSVKKDIEKAETNVRRLNNVLWIVEQYEAIKKTHLYDHAYVYIGTTFDDDDPDLSPDELIGIAHNLVIFFPNRNPQQLRIADELSRKKCTFEVSEEKAADFRKLFTENHEFFNFSTGDDLASEMDFKEYKMHLSIRGYYNINVVIDMEDAKEISSMI